MDTERENLLRNLEIVRAYLTVLERPDDLMRVCASVEGDAEDARSAVARAFEVSDIAADAILQLQVRRFTPRAIEQLRAEIADFERRLRDMA